MDQYCTQCGQAVGEKDMFCTNCGVALSPTQPRLRPQTMPFQEEQPPPKESKYAPLSMGDYLLIGVLMIIPVVNIILLIIWAVDQNGNINRRNMAKAWLIVMGVSIVLSVVTFFGLIAAIIQDPYFRDGMNYNDYYDYYIEHPTVDDWMQGEFEGSEL